MKIEEATKSLYSYCKDEEWFTTIGVMSDNIIILYAKNNIEKIQEKFKGGWEGFVVKVNKMKKLIKI